MTTLGSRLIQSAQEAVAIAKGEADPATYRVHVPADIDVKAIRKGLDLTQAEFAQRFGFPIAHCATWSRAAPGRTARRGLTLP